MRTLNEMKQELHEIIEDIKREPQHIHVYLDIIKSKKEQLLMEQIAEQLGLSYNQLTQLYSMLKGMVYLNTKQKVL